MYCVVVDDDQDSLIISQKILTNLGFHVDTFDKAGVALVSCSQSMPELILLDWRMPDMNGLDFFKRLRGLVGGEAVSVIMCTGEGESSKVQEALDAGVDGYIVKPFNKTTIINQLSSLGIYKPGEAIVWKKILSTPND